MVTRRPPAAEGRWRTIGAFITPACARAPPPAHACELRAARLREQAARIKAAAQDAEDYARLGPRERFGRRIAGLNREHPAAYGALHSVRQVTRLRAVNRGCG